MLTDHFKNAPIPVKIQKLAVLLDCFIEDPYLGMSFSENFFLISAPSSISYYIVNIFFEENEIYYEFTVRSDAVKMQKFSGFFSELENEEFILDHGYQHFMHWIQRARSRC